MSSAIRLLVLVVVVALATPVQAIGRDVVDFDQDLVVVGLRRLRIHVRLELVKRVQPVVQPLVIFGALLLEEKFSALGFFDIG